MRTTALLALLAAAPGCIALHARAHVGPTVDSTGKVGIEGGLMGGFGYSHSTESGTFATVGVATGSEAPLQISAAFEHARFYDDHELGYRAGFAHHAAIVGDRGIFGPQAAVLIPLRSHSSSDISEKSFSSYGRTIWAAGLEATAGGVYQKSEVDGWNDVDVRFGARLALTLELYSFERMH